MDGLRGAAVVLIERTIPSKSLLVSDPQRNDTLVTWGMSGKISLMGKAFGLIVNCDKMLGTQFEKGLASMKSLVEAKE